MLATKTHVLIRVKSDIRLPRISRFAPEGSYLARLSGGGTTLTMRVIEYHVNIDGRIRKGPRAGQTVHPRHLSFTTTRRTPITTVRTGTATAGLPTAARSAAHQPTLHEIATARVTTARRRHRPRKIKTGQAFPHAPRGITTRTAPATVHVCGTTTA